MTTKPHPRLVDEDANTRMAWAKFHELDADAQRVLMAEFAVKTSRLFLLVGIIIGFVIGTACGCVFAWWVA